MNLKRHVDKQINNVRCVSRRLPFGRKQLISINALYSMHTHPFSDMDYFGVISSNLLAHLNTQNTETKKNWDERPGALFYAIGADTIGRSDHNPPGPAFTFFGPAGDL